MGKVSLKIGIESDNLPIVFGISCHENDYRVSWAINQSLNIHLAEASNHKIPSPLTNSHREFSCYQYFDNESIINYRLIANRCDNGFLLESHKNFDFLFIIDDDNKTLNIEELKIHLKSNPLIVAIIPIDYYLLLKKRVL